MIPQKTINKAFLLFLSLFFSFQLISQQRIQIKNDAKDVGHFSVELNHNLPGSPMTNFSGNGGSITVANEKNTFVLRMQNFIWYEGETDLEFNLDDITFKSNTKAAIKQERKIVSLKQVSNYVREIYFEVEGTGNVKMSVPFTYEGGKGTFLQDFNITTKSEALEELSKSDIGKIWRKIDDENESEVKAFLTKYGTLSSAKKYVKKADRALEDIESRKMLAAEEARRKGQNTTNRPVANIEIIEEGELDSEKLVEDVKTIVDSLHFEETDNGFNLYNLSLIYEEKIKILEVSDQEMPLQLNLKEVGKEKMDLLHAISIPTFGRDSAVELSNTLLDAHNIRGAFNYYTITNAQGLELLKSDMILENRATDSTKTNFLIYGLLAAMLGFGGFVFLNNRQKKKKQAEAKKKLQQKIEENKKTEVDNSQVQANQNTLISSDLNEKVIPKKGKIVIGQKVTEKAKVDLVPKSSVPRMNNSLSSSKFKITSKKKAGQSIEYSEFVELVNAQKMINVDLSNIWNDTTIKNIYLAPEFIQDLDIFLADSSNDGIQNELQGAVPEVGGFLMGRFSEKDNSLQVLVEKFVPFVPEYNDVFKIEIGTKTVVDELGDAQDKNPELEVIGWFHTHPGHGLFLSNSDLSVQRHFPADYQVAMEIDSLTKGLDMSFFTRKSSGRMNNSVDRKEGVGWFQWVEIENNNLN